jgi:Pyruvate/2-oxoacid:ferredoxin oxidoreductase gamma subunit
VDTLDLASKAGSPTAQNTVMLGLASASGRLPIEAKVIKKAVSDLTKKKSQDVNLKAFDLGFKSYKELGNNLMSTI